MGAPYYDYLIADKAIIPTEEQASYSEKIIYLPSYQANDSQRKISEKIFTRKELGLPEVGFIYCCFNNSYKITPSIFDSWAKILFNVESSVLFLYADNEEVKKNLTNEIQARGIASDRIIFAGHVAREDYLARYRVADLFLDTSPYNAGTTASDALWAGLPVLTFLGRSFSARMCASILNAIGLPELTANSQQEYEELAINIGRNPNRIIELKKKLAVNRLNKPLFDTRLFTKNLELAYEKVHGRYQAGLSPEHIYQE
jgi:predicted O-linked N-acetylglucosamine transferase (SPINDLY family)